MKVSDYEGGIEAWKVKLAISRAKKLGFKRHDLEDVVQEMVLLALGFVYERSRSNGLSEEQAMSGLFDRRLMDLRKKRTRQASRIEDVPPDERPDYKASYLDRDVDVRIAMQSLGQRQQRICQALFENRTYAEIMANEELNNHELNLELQAIQSCFITAGLTDYLPSRDFSGGDSAGGVLGTGGVVHDADGLVDPVAAPATQDDIFGQAASA